jgi:hypothetical protein
MSKIIKITTDYKSSKDYISTLNNSIEKLNLIEDELKGLMVNLVTTGKWKDWSNNIPLGETLALLYALQA